MISIDITLLIQVVNFLLSLAIINWLIIKPVREVMAKRRAHNDALRGDAAGMNSTAADKMNEYEARLLKARQEMAAGREAAKLAVEKDAQGRLEQASVEARGIRLEATESMRRESVTAQQELDGKVADYAKMALGRLLGV